jgi:hypothetical protein
MVGLSFFMKRSKSSSLFFEALLLFLSNSYFIVA